MRGRNGIEGKTAKVSRSDPAAEGTSGSPPRLRQAQGHSLSRKPCCENRQTATRNRSPGRVTHQPRTKGPVSPEPEKDGERIQTPKDIITNFPRSDETRHWNINLIELFIKHKWTFIRGRAEFVNRNGHSLPRQIASSFCGDNCLEERRGRNGKRKAECVARLPQCSEKCGLG